MADTRSTYQAFWSKIKVEKKVKIRISEEQLSEMTDQEVRRRFRQIRKHISDCKTRDWEFRRKNKHAVLRGAVYSIKEGWIIIELDTSHKLELI